MYTVTITEHFEDWYVADETIGTFETFDGAIRAFTEECLDLLDNQFSGDGRDGYISENLPDFDEDEAD